MTTLTEEERGQSSTAAGHFAWVKEVRARLQEYLDYEARRLREANDELIQAEKRYGKARRELDSFNKGYGR